METVHIRVPFINGTLASIYAERLKFGHDNGDGIAELYEDTARPWKGDQYVVLCPQVTDAKFDCVHSVFGAAMKVQTFSMSFLSAHGLFCLAAHLKQNPCAELTGFTGVVYGFGSSKLCEKLDMNRDQGSPWTAHDLRVPVLYLMEGRPASIYTYWHTATPDPDALLGLQRRRHFAGCRANGEHTNRGLGIARNRFRGRGFSPTEPFLFLTSK